MSVASTVTVSGYSHVALAVGDVDEARRFYCGLLGLEELPRPQFSVPGLWLRVGDLQLHLVSLDAVEPPGPAHHFALHVPTDAFHDTVDALKAAGVPFRGEPSQRVDFGTTVWATTMTDPWGNAIELTDIGPLG